MNHAELAKTIIDLVGGPSNIKRSWNCMTRLRFNLVDDGKVKVEELKKIKQVVDIQDTHSQFQIIIGNHVEEIADEINRQLNKTSDTQMTSEKEIKSNKSIKEIFNQFLEIIAAIFSPILPAIIGAGMLKVIISLVTLFNLLPETSGVLIVFTMIGNSAFYFLPFLIAVSASRKFEVNEFIGLCLAGVLMSPTLISGAVENLVPMSFLGIDIPYMDYSSSVIPIILGLWAMSYISKWVNRVVPAMLKSVLSSALVLIITVPLVLIVFAPLGFYLGEYLSKGLIWLFANAGPFAGALLAGLNPFIIMTGMHYAIMPTAIQSIATNGFDNFWLPFALISNMAQAGAIFAVMYKVKSREDKSIAFSTGLSAIFGISEPGMYGVTLKLKKPLYAAMLASGISGCIAVLLKVKTFAFVAPSVFALPTYVSVDGDKSNLWIILGATLLSFLLAFTFTLFSKVDNKLTSDIKKDKLIIKKDRENDLVSETLVSPLNGLVSSLSEVPDKTFSDKIMGDGIAIKPIEGIVVSPVEGTISVLFRTKHAIGIVSDSGVEILIHIGIDTVDLDGEGFEALVSMNDKVSVGQPLIKFDKELINAKGYNTVTPIVVTNSNKYKSINLINLEESVKKEEPLLFIEK